MNAHSALVAAAIAAVLLPSSSALGETSSASGGSASGSDTGIDDAVTIEIIGPGDGATVFPEVTVTVMTSTDSDAIIESVQLTVDGELQPESCDTAGTCMFDLELEPGTHTLEAIAPTTSGMEYSDSVVITVVERPGEGAATGGESGDPPDGPTGDAGVDAGVDAGATDEGGTDDANADELDSEKSGCACTAGSDGDRAPLLLALLGLIPVLRRRVRH